MNGVDVLTKMIVHVQLSNAEYHQMLLVKKKFNTQFNFIVLHMYLHSSNTIFLT